MRAALTGARWIDSENFHMTLRFAGDVEPVRFEHVWGPRPRRISMVVLVAIGVAVIAGIHTIMLERRSRRNRSTA